MWAYFMRLRLCIVAVFAFSACEMAPQGSLEQDRATKVEASKTTSQKPDQANPAGPIITGRLTDEGVLCQAMRGENGMLYVFEALPEGLQIGDELRVERDTVSEPMPSFCDQGEVIKWTVITKLDNGKSGQVWRHSN